MRAYDKAVELISRFTGQPGFDGVELSIHAWPSKKLAAWARSQEPWTRLPSDRAESEIEAPHPALFPTMQRYGEPTCHLHSSSEGEGDFLRLEWRVGADEPHFEEWSRGWLELCVKHQGDEPFCSDLSPVSACFKIPHHAPLTEPDTDVELPFQSKGECPDGYQAGMAGFAIVPDGTLMITICTPFDGAQEGFAAFDRALVGTLGNISDKRYRYVTPSGVHRKLSWRRR